MFAIPTACRTRHLALAALLPGRFNSTSADPLRSTILQVCQRRYAPIFAGRNGAWFLTYSQVSVWLAGSGVEQGCIHGATDELGFHAVEPGLYVTDLHATVLHLLGLDGRRLEIPGRKRLETDHGAPVLA